MTGTHVPLLGSDLYQIAYLAGGPRRAVEAAVVTMVEDGRLRVLRSIAELHVVDPRPRHPVEAAVLDAAGPPARRSIDAIVRRVRPDARLVAVADGLWQAGLVCRRGGVEAAVEWPWPAVGLTRAGRRALRRLRSDPPVVRCAEALAVALGGRRAWADDELLRVVVFASPQSDLPTDPRTGVRAGGWAGIGWAGGSSGDYGGFGGPGGDSGGGGGGGSF
jgi:uncharacterized membrane protein YgcG